MEKNLKNQQNKKRILILAASSDIGVEVVKKYLDSGWEILAHYNKNKKKLASIKNKNLRLFKLNLSNPVNVENFLKKNNKFLRGIDSFISLTGFLKLSSYENFSINDFYLH